MKAGKINEAIRKASTRYGVPEARIIHAGRFDAVALAARNAVWAELVEMGVTNVEISEEFGRAVNTVNRTLRRMKTGVNLDIQDREARKGGIGRQMEIAPTPPRPPVLPAYRGDWSEIDWMRAMAHEENQAVRARG